VNQDGFCIYSSAMRTYSSGMLMIAAALEEELGTAKSLCRRVEKMQCEKAKLWEGILQGRSIVFLRAGVGPKRSAERLSEAIRVAKPSQILTIGYAGALDPGLKLGSMVAIGKATALRLDDTLPGWEHVHVEGEFDLAPCPSFLQIAEAAGLSASCGDGLTSSHVLGNPAHKQLLFERFHAAVVDMETAALARVARSENIPFSCIRVISDEAEDDFLAPFSYDPSKGIPARAVELVGTGMVETYRAWKTHSAVARECLSRFLAKYLIQIREIRDSNLSNDVTPIPS